MDVLLAVHLQRMAMPLIGCKKLVVLYIFSIHQAHIRQSLESKNGVSFSKENYPLYCRSDCAIQSKSEVDAYQIKL